ncbi:MAG: hypothetical protein ACR2L4_04225 [Actinomycetota bacterium]
MTRHEHPAVTEANFQLSYWREDTPGWHVAYANETHDHPLVILVGGERMTVRVEPPEHEQMIHAAG